MSDFLHKIPNEILKLIVDEVVCISPEKRSDDIRVFDDDRQRILAQYHDDLKSLRLTARCFRWNPSILKHLFKHVWLRAMPKPFEFLRSGRGTVSIFNVGPYVRCLHLVPDLRSWHLSRDEFLKSLLHQATERDRLTDDNWGSQTSALVAALANGAFGQAFLEYLKTQSKAQLILQNGQLARVWSRSFKAFQHLEVLKIDSLQPCSDKQCRGHKLYASPCKYAEPVDNRLARSPNPLELVPSNYSRHLNWYKDRAPAVEEVIFATMIEALEASKIRPRTLVATHQARSFDWMTIRGWNTLDLRGVSGLEFQFTPSIVRDLELIDRIGRMTYELVCKASPTLTALDARIFIMEGPRCCQWPPPDLSLVKMLRLQQLHLDLACTRHNFQADWFASWISQMPELRSLGFKWSEEKMWERDSGDWKLV